MRQYRDHLTPRARDLRQTPTRAEKIIWQFLRRKRIGSLKWRRQQPVGSFIVDFYCPELKLVIELDGASHADKGQQDTVRQSYLEEQGLTVLRFLNGHVYQRKEDVFNTIRHVCISMAGQSPDTSPDHPSPRPSPFHASAGISSEGGTRGQEKHPSPRPSPSRGEEKHPSPQPSPSRGEGGKP